MFKPSNGVATPGLGAVAALAGRGRIIWKGHVARGAVASGLGVCLVAGLYGLALPRLAVADSSGGFVLAALPAAQLQAGVLTAKSPGSDRALTVWQDYGGTVGQYIEAVAQARAAGIRVAILGDCRSACTLYLGAGNVCVSRSATLRFHGPTMPAGSSPEDFDYATQRMAQYYPPAVAQWFLQEARYRTRGTLPLSGAQLIALGVSEC